MNRVVVHSLNRQQGMSSMMWLLVISIAGFALMCAFKIIPPYAENIYVKDALISLTEKQEPLEDMTKSEIKQAILKYYSMNGVRTQGPKNIEVERNRKGLVVNVNYDVQVPLISNIDVLIKFENQLDSTRPTECCKPAKSQ